MPKKIPQRMCTGCQEMKDKKALLRIVRTPEEAIVVDPTGKKPGRGAYVCRDLACFTKAYKEKRLEKAFKQTVSPEIYAALREDIEREQ